MDQATPLLPASQSQIARSWPVIQPPTPTYVSLGRCQTCLRLPSAFGLGGCRIPCYSILALFLFVLLIVGSIILSATVLALVLLVGFLIAFALVYLYFFSPPPELAWKFGLIFQLARVTFYIEPKPSEWKVSDLRPKAPLSTGLLEYAIAVRVPLLSEDELFGGGLFESVFRIAAKMGLRETPGQRTGLTPALLSVLPTRRIEDMTSFKEGENPVQYVMDALRDVYPLVIQEWPDKTSDRALTYFCLHGLGAHRIEPVTDTVAHPGCAFVVKTNQLSGLPVKDGCEHFGNDAYFDKNFHVVKIVREEQVAPWEEDKFTTFYPDGSRDWEYAKFCFRSTLFAMVTFVDHLYGLHLQLSNVTIQAIREQLSVDHPVRRFLVPFTYGSININDLARQALVSRDSWVPRAYPLDDEGLQLAWSQAFELLPGGVELKNANTASDFIDLLFDRERYIELKRRQGLDTPYYQQALTYWKILKKFVNGYITHFYGEGEQSGFKIAADEELKRFILHTINGLQSLAGLLPPGDKVRPSTVAVSWSNFSNERKREIVVNVITRYCDLVSAGHDQVGQVQAYAQDASFCAFSWPKTLRQQGPIVAPKEVAMGQAIIMSLTSTPMPRLLARGPEDDWSHLFPAETKEDRFKLDALFNDFQRELQEFSAFADDYNARASERQFPNNFGLWVFNPKYLETSVSI